MVEVVGTAPTSAMVITKFVYRHSWKSNFINIKVIAEDSITFMKLTKEQSADIKNQQSQSNLTKRVTVTLLEEVLYEAIPALDHGFVRVVDYMGDDTSIVQSARVSYGKGTKKVSIDVIIYTDEDEHGMIYIHEIVLDEEIDEEEGNAISDELAREFPDLENFTFEASIEV